MPYIKADGTELYYEICGSGRPVVFIHGIGVTSRMWDMNKTDICSKYTMITYDLRGVGKSPKTPEVRSTVKLLANDLKGMLDNLDIYKINIVGSSFGAAIALKFSMDFPDKVDKLVLVGAFVDKGGIVRGFGRGFSHILGRYLTHRVLGEFAAKLMMPTASKQKLDYYHKSIISINEEEVKNYCETLKSYSFTPRLEKIKCPTLILCGEHEKAFHPYSRYVNKKIAGSRLEIIPGVGHGWNGERPELFSRKIIEFLQ